MKLKDLLDRKTKLKEKVFSLGKESSDLGQETEQKDLAKYINDGVLPSLNGHKIQKLKNEHRYLLKIGVSLDQEIVKSQSLERQKRIAKLNRQANESSRIRESLNDKIRHHLIKTESLRKESREAHDEERRLRLLAKQEGTPKTGGSMRLNLMEKWLKENIVLGTEELEQAVLKARKHNKEILAQDKISINDKIFRNFNVKMNPETLQVEGFSFLEQNARYMVEVHQRKDNISLDEFKKEVC